MLLLRPKSNPRQRQTQAHSRLIDIPLVQRRSFLADKSVTVTVTVKVTIRNACITVTLCIGRSRAPLASNVARPPQTLAGLSRPLLRFVSSVSRFKKQTTPRTTHHTLHTAHHTPPALLTLSQSDKQHNDNTRILLRHPNSQVVTRYTNSAEDGEFVSVRNPRSHNNTNKCCFSNPLRILC